jgi:uncharacterized repeat protein (TIGR01451 family)
MRIHIRYLLIAATVLLLSTLLLSGTNAKDKSIKPAAIDASSSPHNPVFVGRFQIPGFMLLDEGFADLGVIKTASDTVLAGSDLTYTIEVRNGGPDNADNATLDDPLPTGTTFVSLSKPAGWTCTTPAVGAGGTVNCTNPSLPVDSDDTFTLVVHVPSNTEGGAFFTNTASVSTITPDPNDENNSSSAGTMVGGGSVDIGVTKTANSDTVLTGSDVTYTIQVSNSGPGNAADVTLDDPLPANTTFVSLSKPAGWTCTTPKVGEGGTVNCVNPSLAVTTSEVFTLVVNIPSSQTGIYTNTATVSTSTPDSNDENNSATASTTTVTCLTDLVVTTNADSGPGSLRQAILDACPNATIVFSSNLAGPVTLTSGELLIDKNLTIQGPGANLLTIARSTNAGTPAFRVFTTTAGFTVNISGLTVSNGFVASGNDGGGIFNQNSTTLTLTNVKVSGNSTADAGLSRAGFGGGIYNKGTLNLIGSTVNGNVTGKGITDGSGSGGNGGGIYNSSGVLTIIDSTISGNATGNGAQPGSTSVHDGDGGGIYNALGTLALINSTVSSNTTSTGSSQSFGGHGAGVYNQTGGTMSLTSCTVVNNIASGGFGGSAGGGIYSGSSPASLGNTIVANNVATNSPDLFGSYDSQDYNLIKDPTGATISGATTHNITGQDPNLGPLANNGGLTQTHALLTGSPALDAGSNALLPQDTFDLDSDANTTELLPVDQRGPGFQRVADSSDANTTQTVDIGAYEAQVSVEDISDKTTNEDTPLSFVFNVGDAALITSVTATSSNPTLVPNDPANLSVTGTGSTRTLQINPAANLSGTTTITVTVKGNNFQTMSDTFVLTVNEGGTLAFSSDSYSVSESGGSATITITRTGGSAGTATVLFSTSDGTASTSDYTPVSQTLTFNDGEVSKTINVLINNDNVSESNETVNLTLSNAGGTGQLGAPSTAVLTINDDDAQPALSINDVTQAEGNSGTTAFNFTVTLSAASEQTVTVSYATANGTATAPGDYTAIPNTVLTFAPGQTQKTITVLVNGDTLAETDENFFVNLSGAVNATISDNQGQGAITDDDTSLIQFSSSTYNVAEDGLRATITVNRSGNISQLSTVDYATSDVSGLKNCSEVTGNASSRCDYAISVGTLRFAANEASRTISIPIVNDVYVEGPESFTITLSHVVGGDLGSPSIATVTIDDNDNGGAANPIDDNAFFVRELYIDFLGREPDPPGLRGWLAILNNCSQGDTSCDRIHVAEGFARSDEFGERGYFIYRAYRAAFGRKPSYAEFIPDMAKVSGFLTPQELEANKQAFVNEFVTRMEFRNKYDSLDNSGYVNALEATALVTLPNKQALIDDLNAGRKTRAEVLRAVMETSVVYAKHFNEAFVVMEYFGFLRRDPDALYQSWIDQFNQSNNYRLVINGFINSAEYRQRFGN